MSILTNANYIDSYSPFALTKFTSFVSKYLSAELDRKSNLVIFCIGTDRSTGDSLGPLVGHKLSPLIRNYKNVTLIGTLEKPVHALNLESNIDLLYKNHKDPLVIAIDSSLGSHNRIGYLSIKDSPLKPGSGVNKSLPAIGDISITGIVNISGMMELMVLQNTRLSLVMNMAEIITKSLFLSIYKLNQQNTLQCALEKH